MLCEFIETSGFGLPGSGRCARNPTQGGGTPTWSSCSPGKVCGGGESQNRISTSAQRSRRKNAQGLCFAGRLRRVRRDRDAWSAREQSAQRRKPERETGIFLPGNKPKQRWPEPVHAGPRSGISGLALQRAGRKQSRRWQRRGALHGKIAVRRGLLPARTARASGPLAELAVTAARGGYRRQGAGR